MQNKEKEIWKDVVGYEGIYIISNLGSVIRLKSNKNKKQSLVISKIFHKGYFRVKIFMNGKSKYEYLHRLIAKAFIPNPENKPQVNHKNGIKSDNRVENLEWATNSENQIHSYRVIGNKGLLDKHPSAIEVYKFDINGNFICKYISMSKAARENNVNLGNLKMCLLGKRNLCGGFIWSKSPNIKKCEKRIQNCSNNKYKRLTN